MASNTVSSVFRQGDLLVFVMNVRCQVVNSAPGYKGISEPVRETEEFSSGRGGAAARRERTSESRVHERDSGKMLAVLHIHESCLT